MKRQGELLFLGTGSSAGTPMIGCRCSVCSSDSPYNRRLRPSVLLTISEKKILVDAGPDVREQALHNKIDYLDGLFLTHAHYDHIGGLDDLRVYYFVKEKPLPCFLSRETFEEISCRCPYLIGPHNPEKSFPAQFDFEVSDITFGPVDFLGLPFHIVSYRQLGMGVYGFRLGNMAYLSDLKDFDARVIEEIRGVEYLVVSALREEPSRAHLTFGQAIDVVRAIGAKKTWFTHLNHNVDYEEASRTLPPNVALAYDGLSLPFIINES